MRNYTIFLLSVFAINHALFSADKESLPMIYKSNSPQEIANGDTRINPITKGNFLVVGSFKNISNAKKYKQYLIAKSVQAEVGYYKGTGNYYVYIFESADLSTVRGKRDMIRSKEEFSDAWVMKVGESFASKINSSGAETKLTEDKPLTIDPKTAETTEEPTEIKPTNEAVKNVKQYKVYLNTVEATTYKEIQTSVKMVNGEEGKLEGLYLSHKPHLINVPADEKQEAQFICEIFGYKKIEQDINFSKPITEQSKTYTHLAKDTIILDFELVRYKKGEIFTMFNVFFYNDAAIMLPKSTYELNQLVQMVKENDNLIIKLHGHTNGNQFGKIIKLAENDSEYFNLKPSNVHTKGSAKDLSHERASIIRKYLIEQGIEERRIEIKGWGGSKMLYPLKSPDAKKNVRVEIEILRD